MRIVLPYCLDVPHGFYWDFLHGLTDAIEERGGQAVRFPFAKVGAHPGEEAVTSSSTFAAGATA